MFLHAWRSVVAHHEKIKLLITAILHKACHLLLLMNRASTTPTSALKPQALSLSTRPITCARQHHQVNRKNPWEHSLLVLLIGASGGCGGALPLWCPTACCTTYLSKHKSQRIRPVPLRRPTDCKMAYLPRSKFTDPHPASSFKSGSFVP